MTVKPGLVYVSRVRITGTHHATIEAKMIMIALAYHLRAVPAYWDANLAVRSDPIQTELMYLDEKEFPRIKDARPGDFTENSFAENLKSSGFLQALTK